MSSDQVGDVQPNKAAPSLDDIEQISSNEEMDIGGKEYVRQKLARRARLAAVISTVAIGGGLIVIALGLFKPGYAERIDHMGTFLSLFFGSCFAVILGYMGLGSYELSNSAVGQGSRFGASNYGGVRGRGSVGSGAFAGRNPSAGPTGAGSAGLGLDGEDGRNAGRSGQVSD